MQQSRAATLPPFFVSAARWLARGLAIWLAAMIISYDVRVYSRAVLVQFSAGTSWVKPLYLVGWMLCCSLLASVPVVPAARSRRRTLIWVSIGLALPVIAHFWFNATVGVSPTSRTISFIHREGSSNELVHIHAFKGMLWVILSAFNSAKIANSTDPGAIYASVLPVWFFLCGAAVIAYASWLLYAALPQLVHGWSGRKRILAIPYLICSGGIVKSFVDGGPFDSQTLALLPALIALMLYSSGSIRKFLTRFYLIFFCALLVNCTGFYLCYGQYWRGLPEFFSTYCWLAALTLGLTALSGAWSFRLAAVLGVALHIALALSFKHTWWREEYRRFQTQLVPGDTVIMTAFFGEETGVAPVAQEGPLKTYRFEVKKPERLYDYYRRFGISTGFSPFSMPGRNCAVSDSFTRKGDLFLLSGSIRNDTPLPDYILGFTLTPCAPGESCSHHYEMVERGCTPDEAEQNMVNHLDQAGVETGVLREADRNPPPPWPSWLRF